MASVTLRLWQQILTHIRNNNSDIVKPWFNTLQAAQLENGVLEIRTRSSSHARYLREHATGPFTQSAQEVTGHLVGVRFVSDPKQSGPEAPQDALPERDLYQSLKEDYTFDTFVVAF